jgi:hypothetical protein
MAGGYQDAAHVILFHRPFQLADVGRAAPGDGCSQRQHFVRMLIAQTGKKPVRFFQQWQRRCPVMIAQILRRRGYNAPAQSRFVVQPQDILNGRRAPALPNRPRRFPWWMHVGVKIYDHVAHL